MTSSFLESGICTDDGKSFLYPTLTIRAIALCENKLKQYKTNYFFRKINGGFIAEIP